MDDAQMAALVAQWRKQLENTMSELKLRQWAIEQAIRMQGDGPALLYADNSETPIKIQMAGVKAAREILEFITEPFAELFKDQ